MHPTCGRIQQVRAAGEPRVVPEIGGFRDTQFLKEALQFPILKRNRAITARIPLNVVRGAADFVPS